MKLIQKFEEGWWLKLSPFLCSTSFGAIGQTLTEDIRRGNFITPIFDDTFRAFKECPYKDLKVVILGQDPYPGDGIADGLAFSSRYSSIMSPPNSLKFMLDSMEKDCYGGFGIGYNEKYNDTDLTRWANQGVLLLNTALSTRVGQIGSHMELWQPFTQYVFKVLRENNKGLIYILLGAYAKQWRAAIDMKSNYVLTASHPNSIMHNGKKEWDCEEVFSKANNLLKANNGVEYQILW